MNKLIIFFSIAFLLASCGSSTSFSKRQHLKGHFWKKSDGMRSISKHKTEEHSNYIFEDSEQEELNENDYTPESIYSADERIINAQILEDQNLEDLVEDDATMTKSKIKGAKSIKASSKVISISANYNEFANLEDNNTEQTKLISRIVKSNDSAKKKKENLQREFDSTDKSANRAAIEYGSTGHVLLLVLGALVSAGLIALIAFTMGTTFLSVVLICIIFLVFIMCVMSIKEIFRNTFPNN